MFEEAPPTAALPGVDPVTGWPVAWHPDTFDWVALAPSDLVDDDLLPGFLERSAGVLPADADRVAAGPELAALLAAFDPARATGYDLVEAVAGWARLAAWVAANEARALAELAGRAEMRPVLSGYRSVNPVTNTAVEIAGRCQVTARQAENQVGHALQLIEDFPDTHMALSAGAIDLRRARVITDELGGQEPAVRARVEAAVLPKAPSMDAVSLRKLVKRQLHELAPVETAVRHRIARDGRCVTVTPVSEGMAWLEARLPAEDATALNTALNVAAADAKRADAAAGAPARTKDQRRADALAELGWAALAACAGGAAPGQVAQPRRGGRTRAGEGVGRPGGAGRPGIAEQGEAAGRAEPEEGAGRPGRAEQGAAAGRAEPEEGAGRPGDAGQPELAKRGDGAAGRERIGLGEGTWRPGRAKQGESAGQRARVEQGGPAGWAEPAVPPEFAELAVPPELAERAGPGTDADLGRPAASGTTPGVGRRRRAVSVHVTVPFTTIAGLADLPGELDGYGPIPAQVARELAAAGVWTWQRVDPASGQLLDAGRRSYRPTRALAEFIVARDRTCRMPGCHRSARTCDIDHLVPFAAGGATSAANCHVLCETHHLLKHHGNWTVERRSDGSTRWLSPTGHRYRRPLEPVGSARAPTVPRDP
ncbi:DUF222 domain-containing protein [Jiangella anatolica]|uniref:HNH nuclease domain-containing protein n=1 Tax=Jiangella anatolica TaxID=2670374 RepID=A0A2W2B541_9ACTN|nr:DUF222 domain-containing protein [Jiangella anatolica]PZF80120.1 hypothetical protein C1I92_27665 [Jiangella anatolica]